MPHNDDCLDILLKRRQKLERIHARLPKVAACVFWLSILITTILPSVLHDYYPQALDYLPTFFLIFAYGGGLINSMLATAMVYIYGMYVEYKMKKIVKTIAKVEQNQAAFSSQSP